MHRGLPEVAAKKATIAFTTVSEDVAVQIWHQHRVQIEADEEWQKLDALIRDWPAVGDVGMLMQEGIEPTVAMQIVITARGKKGLPLCMVYETTKPPILWGNFLDLF